jgi:hypothetical protein
MACGRHDQRVEILDIYWKLFSQNTGKMFHSQCDCVFVVGSSLRIHLFHSRNPFQSFPLEWKHRSVQQPDFDLDRFECEFL